MSATFNLPPGVTEADVSGAGSRQLYTIEFRVRVYVHANSEADALTEAAEAVELDSNADICGEEVIDHEPA